MKERYYNAWETARECTHSWPDGETALLPYRVERYHGKIKKCSLCHKKMVLDTSSDGPVGYIEQASLWSVPRETKDKT